VHDLTSTRTPVGLYLAAHHVDMTLLLGYYHSKTPGVWLASRPTITLPTGDVIQPHLAMLIQFGPCFKRFEKVQPEGLVRGAPQLAVDIAWAIDEVEEERRTAVSAAGGVDEYLLIHHQRRIVHWYRTEGGRPSLVAPDAHGIIKSSALPGLWISVSTIWDGAGRYREWTQLIDQGVLSHEHAERLRSIRGSK
jgi:hypothetical protein